MYASTPEAYKAYAATFVGWGGARTAEAVKMHHDLGIRCTGTIWCLTAGAELIHKDAELRQATVLDIEGKPVAVPWLFDHVYKDTPSYFGCTNSPAFRKLNRDQVREAMAGGADGLHIDDPRGVATPALMFGGGFCDHCMAGFRDYLRRHAEPEQLRDAGVTDPGGFDYRDLVRKHAATRREYLEAQKRIPLMDLFLKFHAQAAAENVREIIEVAREAAGHPILVSVNAFGMEETFLPILRLDAVTHVICEVAQGAKQGTSLLGKAIEAYDQATRLGKPIAATGSGHDWAYVKAHDVVNLVKIWIALAYAHGQRFMVPHPSRQWCFTEEMGTHWYAAPVGEYAPIYRFIREHAERFDGYAGVERAGVRSPEGVICTVRTRPGAAAVVHAVNTRYTLKSERGGPADRITPARDVTVALPADVARGAAQATLLSCDGEPRTVPLRAEASDVSFVIPELRVWTLCVLQ